MKSLTPDFDSLRCLTPVGVTVDTTRSCGFDTHLDLDRPIPGRAQPSRQMPRGRHGVTWRCCSRNRGETVLRIFHVAGEKQLMQRISRQGIPLTPWLTGSQRDPTFAPPRSPNHGHLATVLEPPVLGRVPGTARAVRVGGRRPQWRCARAIAAACRRIVETVNPRFAIEVT